MAQRPGRCTIGDMPRVTALFLAASLIPLAAPAKNTIMVITDAEGVAGICRQDQTDTKDPELRQLLTGEVNAAVEGFYQGGADEVIVWDGHGGSATLSAATIHPRAKLMIGYAGANYTFDRRYTALAFVGQHSMANVRAGIMAHSYSSLGIQNMLLSFLIDANTHGIGRVLPPPPKAPEGGVKGSEEGAEEPAEGEAPGEGMEEPPDGEKPDEGADKPATVDFQLTA